MMMDQRLINLFGGAAKTTTIDSTIGEQKTEDRPTVPSSSIILLLLRVPSFASQSPQEEEEEEDDDDAM